MPACPLPPSLPRKKQCGPLTADWAMVLCARAYTLARCVNVASSGVGLRVPLTFMLWSLKPSYG